MLAERHPLLFYSMVVVTFIVALLVSIAPLPGQYQVLRPELVCLLVIYWIISTPQHLGMSFAFLIGIVQDVIEHVVWGGHAFGLVLVAYICLHAYQRMKSYSIWHQTLWVSVLVGLHQVSVNWVQSLSGHHASISSLLASIVISALLWPLMTLLLLRFRHHLGLM